MEKEEYNLSDGCVNTNCANNSEVMNFTFKFTKHNKIKKDTKLCPRCTKKLETKK